MGMGKDSDEPKPLIVPGVPGTEPVAAMCPAGNAGKREEAQTNTREQHTGHA